MKKNLISIIILALLIVNIILTAVMMLSVTGAARRTSNFIDSAAKALNLELTAQTESGEREVVAIENTATYSISESMTIPLRDSVDEEGNRSSHFCMASISFYINMKNDGYKKYTEDLSPQEERIKDMINTVFAQYTLEEAKGNEEALKEEILEGVQKIYDSDFIFDVGFGSILYQ